MINTRIVWLLILMATMSFGCTTAGLLTEWRAPYHHGASSFKNILVVGCADNVSNRYSFEETFVQYLRDEQVRATASMEAIPGTSQPSEEQISALVKKGQFDAVLRSDLTGADDEKIALPEFYSGNYPEYYDYVYGRELYIPNYTQKTVKIKTTLYDVETKKLVWTIQSETITHRGKISLSKASISPLIDQLKKNGF